MSDPKQEESALRAYVLLRREQIRKTLHQLYLPFYDRLCEKLEGTFWAPYSGTRSVEEQLKLYQQGRTPESLARGEKIVTNAIPGNSAHNWGCATDWFEMRPEFRNTEFWRKAFWPQYEIAVKAVGLVWGGDWDRDGVTEKGEDDFPHNQLALSVPWRAVGDQYRDHGAASVDAFLISKLVANSGDKQK